MAKANIVGGIALLSPATCSRPGLVRRILAASDAGWTLMTGLDITSARAQGANRAGAMGVRFSHGTLYRMRSEFAHGAGGP